MKGDEMPVCRRGISHAEKLPMQGLRVALRGEVAQRFTLSCEARTASGTLLGPVGDGELCGLEEPEAIAAVRITIGRRPAARGRAKR